MHYDCIPGIVHRDMSSNNILFDSEYSARQILFAAQNLLDTPIPAAPPPPESKCIITINEISASVCFCFV